ncbi:MAG: SH3 domain-containing protein [Silicimonas sp.]|nr:SH3 domain-containing protein [Silicimonas sp.]
MIRTLVCAFFAATTAHATVDGWPALHDVVDVAEDDVLNIRSGPGVSFDIIGTLAHDDENIEVIRPDERFEWGLVNQGEGSGWVALGFLQRRPGQWWGQKPAVTQCFGTEPFWSLSRQDGLLSFDRPDEIAIRVDEAYFVPSGNNRDRFVLSGSNIASGLTLLLRTEACSDGMSDQAFGIAADLVLEDAFDASLYSGCCTIQPPAE